MGVEIWVNTTKPMKSVKRGKKLLFLSFELTLTLSLFLYSLGNGRNENENDN